MQHFIGTYGYNVVGSYVAWMVGRYGGQGAWRSLTRLAASSDGPARAQRWFDKYGARSVFIGRLLPVIWTSISLPAGFARVAPARWGLYTVAGCIPWITALTVAGDAAGANWHRVTGLVQQASYVVIAVAVILVVAIVIFMLRAPRRRQAAPHSVALPAAINDHADLDRAARAAVSDGPRHRKAD